MDLVREIFGEDEAETIQKIPISSTGAEDRLIWQGTKDGVFTMKSAYYLQNELNALMFHQSCLIIKKKTIWTRCWSFKIPNALKTFMWRACLESLPTRLNLAKKRICESPKCLVCLSEDETMIHILWNCPFAIDVWRQGPSGLHKSSIRPRKFSDLVEALISTCDQETMELFAIITRSIWGRRNQFIFENSFAHPFALAQIVKNSLQEFKAARQKPQASSRGMVEGIGIWNPPPPSVIKIYWDA
ncbi:uncharacterized protein LOC122276753 [Carya illinoinensis]|uniref:uncharacterized protein LOC122276753 n=1 Tax=Carya illinoinensis TaxID=32201 RepID=UPI001C7297BB|nr:uncharacterized protein LOC122276753 [Carya illinoinensis]